MRAPQPHRAAEDPLHAADLVEQAIDRREVRIGAEPAERPDEREVALAEQPVDHDVQLDELLERVPAGLVKPILDGGAQLGRALGASRSSPASPCSSCTHRTREVIALPFTFATALVYAA